MWIINVIKKNLMTVVRGMSNEWSVMTNQCVAKGL